MNASDARNNARSFYKNNTKILQFLKWVEFESLSGKFGGNYYYHIINESTDFMKKLNQEELKCLRSLGYNISENNESGNPLPGYYEVSWK